MIADLVLYIFFDGDEKAYGSPLSKRDWNPNGFTAIIVRTRRRANCP